MSLDSDIHGVLTTARRILSEPAARSNMKVFLNAVLFCLCASRVLPQTADQVQAATTGDLRGESAEIWRNNEARSVPNPGGGPALLGPLPGPQMYRSLIQPASGTVSATRLRHVAPKGAQRHLSRGRKFANAGKNQLAINEFEMVLLSDPGFLEVHNELGIQYALTSRYKEALAQFQHVIELDAGSPLGNYDLALAWFLNGDAQRAEAAVRQAVALWPGNDRAQFFLGWLLLDVPEHKAEAVEHLQRAARTIHHAADLLTELHNQGGRQK